jgi:DNA-binding NtrC family response regulator
MAEILNSAIFSAQRIDGPFLILGETGTGKELVAKTLHDYSSRADKRFVPVDATSIIENLATSDLFGHVQGAFTDARNRDGFFKEADGGTLFLDEVARLLPRVQENLLRVLQERKFRQTGGKEIESNFRLISATNCNLNKLVEEGLFLKDLLYRINAFPIELPPLRDRGHKDIMLLVDHFVQIESQKQCWDIQGIKDNARQALLEYPWPGNIRELKNMNMIERAITAAAYECREQIELKDLVDDKKKPIAAGSAPNQAFIPSSSNLVAIPFLDGDDEIAENLNPGKKRELTCDDSEVIKRVIDECRGQLNSASKVLKAAGYEKNASRGRLRNMVGDVETESAICPELAQWYRLTYPKKNRKKVRQNN